MEKNNVVKPAHVSILVVDDDEMVRKIIIEQLQGVGFNRFIEAVNGSEAYRIFIDPLQRVDLIICDWEMPKTDGHTLLRAVRASRVRSDTPFIMVTSQQSQERTKITKAAKSEVDAYIVKPFRAEVLRQKVLEVVMDAIDKKVISA
jgi:CheY-like chemotaxis protein